MKVGNTNIRTRKHGIRKIFPEPCFSFLISDF